MLSPEYGYYNIPPCGEKLPVIGKNEESGVYTVCLPNGYRLHYHESKLKKQHRVQKRLNHRELEKEARNSFHDGKDPFPSLNWSKPKKRWNNFDDEIHASIYAFCHDAKCVRPDNYLKRSNLCLL